MQCDYKGFKRVLGPSLLSIQQQGTNTKGLKASPRFAPLRIQGHSSQLVSCKADQHMVCAPALTVAEPMCVSMA